ncbi:MAG: ABC transporter substrate-binding protein [Stellaceae bacterium]
MDRRQQQHNAVARTSRRAQRKILAVAAASFLIVAATSGIGRAAEPPLKIGVIMTYSGPFAFNGRQADLGIATYLKVHGDTIAGRKIEIVRKDDTGLRPDVAKREAQELVVQDHVAMILGGCWSPNALASVPVVNTAKVPFFILVAATPGIPQQSPYMIRLSLSLNVPSYIIGEWASAHGWKKGYNAVADYVLGTTAANAFTKGMAVHGGTIVGEVRMPVGNPDIMPYVQRIKNARPQVVQLSVPIGFMSQNFAKAFYEAGLQKDGIHLMTGDLSETQPTNTLGDYVNGVYTASFYVDDNPSPANQVYIKAFRAVTHSNKHPGFVALAAYDALTTIRQVVEEQHGKVDPQRTMALLDNHQFVSPRGPIAFDNSGEIIENWYLRKAERVNGKMEMKLVKTFKMVHPPVLRH